MKRSVQLSGNSTVLSACVLAGTLAGMAYGQPVSPMYTRGFTALLEDPTALQSLSPAPSTRATTLDGLMDGATVFPWALNADSLGAGLRRPYVGPVSLASGAVLLREADLALPARAAWPIGRSYSNGQQVVAGMAGIIHWDSDGPQGADWSMDSLPALSLIEAGTPGSRDADDMLVLVLGAGDTVQFRRTAASTDTFAGVNGASGVIELVHTTGLPDVWVLHEQRGTLVYFFGFDTASGVAAGKLWKYELPDGSAAYIGDPSAADDAISAGFDSSGRLTTAFDSAGRRFTYTYSSSAIGGCNRLNKVQAETDYESETPYLVAEVDYAYYTSSGSDGLAGDLQSATILTRTSVSDQWDQRTTLYRYFVGGNQYEPAHHLRLLVAPEGVRKYDWVTGGEGFSNAFLSATDSQLAAYATVGLTYASEGVVATAWFNGQNGSSDAYTFTFEPNSSFSDTSNAYDTAWASRTVVHLPQATDSLAGDAYDVQYFDEAFQPLSTVVTDGDPAGEEAPAGTWVTQVIRGEEGLLTEIRSPAANDTYTHSTGAIAAKNTAGLTTLIDRVAGGEDDEAGLDGLVRSIKVREGVSTSQPAYWLARFDYTQFSQSISGVPLLRPWPKHVRSYHTETTSESTSGQYNETTLDPAAYTSYPLVPELLTVTLPAVPGSQHGNDTSYVRKTWFNPDGSASFTKSEGGRIDYREYDSATGLLTRFVNDADTSALESEDPAVTVPTGASSNGSGAELHRVTSYSARDDLGRPLTIVAPGARESQYFYGVLADRELVSIVIPRVTHAGSGATYFGPARVSVFNQSMNLVASGLLNLGPDPTPSTSIHGNEGDVSFVRRTGVSPSDWLDWSTSSKDTLLEAVNHVNSSTDVRGLVSLTTYDRSADGSRVEDSYTYSKIYPETGDPVRYGSSYMYDNRGRVIGVTDPTGTIDRVRYDPIGRAVEAWRGTDDTDFPTGSSFNLIRTDSFQYDFGDSGGNSLLTQVSRYLDGGSTGARVTDLRYDWRGRMRQYAPPEPPFAMQMTDNLGRSIATGLYSGTRSSFLSNTDWDPTDYTTGRQALSETWYDPRGQVWRDRRWNIDPSTGDVLDSDPVAGAIDNNYWYGAHGHLRLATGEQIVKYQYTRVCECEACYHLAAAVASPDATYAGSVASDIVLAEEHYIRDRETGRILAELGVHRRPVYDVENPVPLGPLMSIDAPTGGPNVTTNRPSSGTPWTEDFRLELPADIPHGIDLRIIKSDELDRPWKYLNFGDAGAPGSSGPICCGYGASCTNPIGTDEPFKVRETIVGHDPREIFNMVVYGDGQTSLREYDDAGRMTADRPYHGVVYPRQDLSTDKHNPCAANSPWTEYLPAGADDGRIREIVFHAGTNELSVSEMEDTQITRIYYPNDFTSSHPLPSGLPSRDLHDNNLPIGIIMPDHAGDGPPSSLTDAWWLRYNAQRELDWWRDPAGNTFQRSFDGNGRLGTEDMTPASGFDPTATRRSFTYDGLGRMLGVAVVSPSTPTTIYNDVDWHRDGWGALSDLRQSPFGALPTYNPASIGNDQIAYSYSLHAASDSWPDVGTVSGYHGVWRDGMSLPGSPGSGSGILGMLVITDDYRTRSDSRATPYSEPAIDSLIGRVSSISVSGDSPELATYGYYGIAYTGWFEMPHTLLQRPIHFPGDQFPSTSGVPFTTIPQWICNLDPLGDDGFTNRWGEPLHDTYLPSSGDPLLPDEMPGSSADNPWGPKPRFWEMWPKYDDRGLPVAMRDTLSSPAIDGVTPDSGVDKVLGYDCRKKLIWASGGINPRRYDRDHGQMEGASAGPGPVDQRLEVWWDDGFGNWAKHWDRVSGGFSGTLVSATAPEAGLVSPADHVYTGTYNDANEQTLIMDYQGATTDPEDPQPPVSASISPTYDANGNLTDDGLNWKFVYDGYGRLATVKRRSDDSLFAKYTYNALGWRTSAVWDLNSSDGDLDNETLEEYRYDESWQLVAILVRGPVSAGERPAPKLYQRFVYHADGLGGNGSSRGLDLPLYRERDTNLDGEIDERAWYMSNARHDVVGLVVPYGEGRRVVERVRYSPYGVPTCFVPADLNLDGVVDDQDVDLLTAGFASSPPTQDWRLDIEQDGDFDLSDQYAFYYGPDSLDTLYGNDSRRQVTALRDNRFGFAGYIWDPYVGVYFVRNRVYDPARGRWLQRDPSLYHDGFNLYAYCHGDPIGFIDPMGLGAIDDWWYYFGEGYESVKDSYSDGHLGSNFLDGIAEITHPETQTGVVFQKTAVATVVTVATAGAGVVVIGGTAGSAAVAGTIGSYSVAAGIGGISAGLGDAAAQGIAIAQGNQAEFSGKELTYNIILGAVVGAALQGVGDLFPSLTKPIYVFGDAPAAPGSRVVVTTADEAGAGVGTPVKSTIEGKPPLPPDAAKALGEIRSGSPRPNVRNPQPFGNDGRGGTTRLPSNDSQGNPITYTEHTVNPRPPGGKLDGKRIIVGDDGSTWYTGDHFQTWQQCE